jgi:hypothetical protein
MSIKSVEGVITQTAANTDTTIKVPLMTNTVSKYGIPLIRVLNVTFEWDPTKFAAMSLTASASLILFRWPLSVKVPSAKIAFRKSSSAGIFETLWDMNAPSGFPLIAADSIGITITCNDGAIAHAATYQMLRRNRKPHRTRIDPCAVGMILTSKIIFTFFKNKLNLS